MPACGIHSAWVGGGAFSFTTLPSDAFSIYLATYGATYIMNHTQCLDTHKYHNQIRLLPGLPLSKQHLNTELGDIVKYCWSMGVVVSTTISIIAVSFARFLVSFSVHISALLINVSCFCDHKISRSPEGIFLPGLLISNKWTEWFNLVKHWIKKVWCWIQCLWWTQFGLATS